MFDAPIEDWYVWMGVAAVSVAVLGVALGFPTTAPPKAGAAAETIDRVATSPPGATETRPLRADEIRLGQRRIRLRGDGETARATVTYGPMTPALADERLGSVLDGERPTAAFESPAAFRAATAAARNRSATWRPAPESLRVRRVSWEGIDVVLVG